MKCGETGPFVLCFGSISRTIWPYQANVKMHILFKPRFQLPLSALQTTQTGERRLPFYSQRTFSTTEMDTDWSLCSLQVKVTPSSSALMEVTQTTLELILFSDFKSTVPPSRNQRRPSSPVWFWTAQFRDSSEPSQVFRIWFSVLPFTVKTEPGSAERNYQDRGNHLHDHTGYIRTMRLKLSYLSMWFYKENGLSCIIDYKKEKLKMVTKFCCTLESPGDF